MKKRLLNDTRWMFALIKATLNGKLRLRESLDFLFSRITHFRRSFTLKGINFPLVNQEIWELSRNIFLFDEYHVADLPIAKTDAVVDVGAHQGVFVAFASTFTKGPIYAFEPDDDNFSALEKLIAVNKLGNVKASKVALGNSNGSVKLYRSVKSTRHSTQPVDVLTGEMLDNFHKAESITLDQALAELDRIGLMKMDCEGAEFEIIASSSSRTLGKIQTIIMEYHGYVNDEKTNQLLARLIDEGFSTKLIPMGNNIPLGMIHASRANLAGFD